MVRKLSVSLLLFAFVAIALCAFAEDASAQRAARGRIGGVARAGRLARNVAFRGIRRSSALFVPFGVSNTAGYAVQQTVIAQPAIVVQPQVIQTSVVTQQTSLAYSAACNSSAALVSDSIGVNGFAFRNRGFGARGFRGRR